MIATAKGHLEIAKFLIDKGADVNIVDRNVSLSTYLIRMNTLNDNGLNLNVSPSISNTFGSPKCLLNFPILFIPPILVSFLIFYH